MSVLFTKQIKPGGKEVSLERETMIAKKLMVHMEGIRKDVNVGLLANYIKLIVLAYENSYMFHESEMETMQTELKLRIIDMIFEEDAKKELISMLKNESLIL